jgi:hypothetical protein
MHFGIIFIFLSFQLVVKSYVIADMSIFGNCVLHIKRFRDSSITVDITSIVVESQTRTNNQPMVSIFSANMTRFIKPEGRIREECSLHIIIGFVQSDTKLLSRFMNSNPYTYLSGPNSISILILDSLRNLASFPKALVALPSSIFVLKFPTYYLRNQTALNSSPSYLYLCLSCRVILQSVVKNSDIRFLTEYSYQKEWKRTYLTMQIISRSRMGKITRCEKYIWIKWLAPERDTRRTIWGQCNKPAAFWDLAFRLVHPNFTLHLLPKAKYSQAGYSGTFSQKFYNRDCHPSAWQISSSYYTGAAMSGIIYCDCKRRTESVSFEIWNIGLGMLEWAFIIGMSAIVSNYYYSMGKGTPTYTGEAFNVFGIILRQGSNKGFLLALFSLGMSSVSLLFENTVTSSLVAPKNNPTFDLVELVDEGYRILITGPTSNEFGSQLPFLQDEFFKCNLTLFLDSVALQSTEIMNNPRTFAEDKFSKFFISTMKDKQLIQQVIKSKVPPHCMCPLIRNDFSHFPVYSFFHHKLTFRIFESVQLLTEAGFHNFLDWNIERLAPNFISKPLNVENPQSTSDSFISLNNLSPLLLIFSFLILFSFLTFSFELRYMAYQKCVMCRFKWKIEKLFLLAIDSFRLIKNKSVKY